MTQSQYITTPVFKTTTYDFGSANYELVIVASGGFHDSTRTLRHQNLSNCTDLQKNIKLSLIDGELIFNPMKIPSVEVPQIILDQASAAEADNFVEYHRATDVKLVSIQDLEIYAEAIVNLGLQIQKYPCDCTVVPLRGGFKPAAFLQKMGVLSDDVQFVRFTQGSSDRYDDLAISDLKTGVERFYRGQELFRINVIDCGNKGYGSTKLVSLIKALRKCYQHRCWEVRFFLLHPPGGSVSAFESIVRETNEEVAFVVHRHRVEDLIYEDWDAAIGLSAVKNGDKLVLRNSDREGKVILKSNASISVISSPDLARTMDVITTQFLSDAVRTHPSLTFRRNAWDRI
jgi:hypothetical protein